MPTKHDQLTVREIRGPYMQLLTNLQGESGHEWLEALKVFNAKKNPWPIEVEDIPLALFYPNVYSNGEPRGRPYKKCHLSNQTWPMLVQGWKIKTVGELATKNKEWPPLNSSVGPNLLEREEIKKFLEIFGLIDERK